AAGAPAHDEPAGGILHGPGLRPLRGLSVRLHRPESARAAALLSAVPRPGQEPPRALPAADRVVRAQPDDDAERLVSLDQDAGRVLCVMRPMVLSRRAAQE